MQLAVSTHWNTYRHASGEAMIEEILALGVDSVELGYDLRIDMVPGVKSMVESGAVKVNSVHNFCPVPPTSHRGHPEIYTPGSMDRMNRDNAVTYMTRTIEFAAELGARAVVAHAGNVKMKRLSEGLIEWCELGRQFTPPYEKMKLKAQTLRDRKAPKQLDFLRQSIDRLLPVLERHRITLAFENLPSWEAIPTEIEMETLIRQYNSPYLKAWFDFGHAYIRQNLGFINAERWAERLAPHYAGTHIHDVIAPVRDHAIPGRGCIPFKQFKFLADRPDLIKVLEPSTGAPAEDLKEGIAFLKTCWQDAPDQTNEAINTEEP